MDDDPIDYADLQERITELGQKLRPRRGGREASELVRPVVASYLTKQRNDPDVMATLTALKNRRAHKDGKLSNLRRRIAAESAPDP